MGLNIKTTLILVGMMALALLIVPLLPAPNCDLFGNCTDGVQALNK